MRDPIWQVTPCSSEIDFHEELYTLKPLLDPGRVPKRYDVVVVVGVVVTVFEKCLMLC